MLKKYTKNILILLTLSLSIQSHGEDQLLDFEYFKKAHRDMVEVLISVEQSNQYSTLFPVEGSTSSYSNKFLNSLLQFKVHAASSDLCFFGGWPSYKRRGLCKEPWKFNTKSEFGLSYDSDHYCGHDNMFRCNPILFGPGDGKLAQDDNGGGKSSGKCINFKENGGSIKTVTKQCFEKTQDNIDEIYKLYLEDEEYQDSFNKLKEEMTLFCMENPSYGACNYLLGRIETLEKGFMCLNVDGNKSLEIASDAIEELAEIPNHLKGRNRRAFELRMQRERSLAAPEVSILPVARPTPEETSPVTSLRPVARPERSISSDSCQFFDKFKAAGVNEKALKQALYFYEQNKDRFDKERYISIADYGMRSDESRFFILDMTTGIVTKEDVSHGSGNRNGRKIGDSSHDGRLNRCHHGNNINDRTNMTRGGFFSTSSLRNSPNHGPSSWPSLDNRGNDSMWMDGLSPGVNEEARGAYVVMHGASYNKGGIMGRSYGCPAFRPERAAAVINRIKGGSLYYSYVPQCSSLQKRVDAQVAGWEGMCR